MSWDTRVCITIESRRDYLYRSNEAVPSGLMLSGDAVVPRWRLDNDFVAAETPAWASLGGPLRGQRQIRSAYCSLVLFISMNVVLDIYFSYGQFFVLDRQHDLINCVWTSSHGKQGFARLQSEVCFATVLEFGDARVSILFEAYRPLNDYDRVIAVPFESVSGRSTVHGPEDSQETIEDLTFDLPIGHYRLTAAQSVVEEEQQLIDLFFEKLSMPLAQSTILIADDQLDPPTVLLER
jgi:hypothetical protein